MPSSPTPTGRSAYDARVGVLYRMTNRALARMLRGHGYLDATHPLEQWSKDELVTAVLSEEFPAGAPSA